MLKLWEILSITEFKNDTRIKIKIVLFPSKIKRFIFPVNPRVNLFQEICHYRKLGR